MLQVWVEHSDLLWELCDVIEEIEDGKLYLKSQSSGILQTVFRASTIDVDPSHLINISDLCAMNSLHEAPLLDLLRRRFSTGTIFSKIGEDDIIGTARLRNIHIKSLSIKFINF